MRRFLWNNPSLKDRRKELRNRATEAERILWKHLQKSQIGYKFRRQASVGNYILDFYCPDRKIAVELDGFIHQRRSGMDQYRTRTLRERGIKVIRFWNGEVEKDIEEVMKKISTTLFDSPS